MKYDKVVVYSYKTKIMKKIFTLTTIVFCLMIVLSGCKKDEPEPFVPPTVHVPVITGVQAPCTDTLQDNFMCTSCNPDGSAITPSMVDSRIFKGAPLTISLADPVSIGTYTITSSTPSPGEAKIVQSYIFGGTYTASSGTLYVYTRDDYYVFELCDIPFLGGGTPPSHLYARLVVPKP